MSGGGDQQPAAEVGRGLLGGPLDRDRLLIVKVDGQVGLLAGFELVFGLRLISRK
jgi:hypothetical protein